VAHVGVMRNCFAVLGWGAVRELNGIGYMDRLPLDAKLSGIALLDLLTNVLGERTRDEVLRDDLSGMGAALELAEKRCAEVSGLANYASQIDAALALHRKDEVVMPWSTLEDAMAEQRSARTGWLRFRRDGRL